MDTKAPAIARPWGRWIQRRRMLRRLTPPRWMLWLRDARLHDAWLRRVWRRPATRRRILLTITALGVAYVATAAWLDRRGQRDAPAGARYDAIVVLGCRVRADGTASPSLRRRAELAARLYADGLAPRVVLTGGVGTYPPSEARAAAEIARRAGVPEDAIVLEERSTSTEENAREAAAQLGAGARVLVVSDAYHVTRAARVFGRHFAEVDGAGALGPPSQRVRGALREVAALLIYGALGRL